MSTNSGKPAKPERLLDFLELAAGHLESKGIDSARLDAELLLARALDVSRVEAGFVVTGHTEFHG